MFPQKILELPKGGGRIGAAQTERGERSGGVGIARGEGERLTSANGGEKSRGKAIARSGGVHRLHGKARRGERALGRLDVATRGSQLDDNGLYPRFAQTRRDSRGFGFPGQLLTLLPVGKNEIRVRQSRLHGLEPPAAHIPADVHGSQAPQFASSLERGLK